MNPETLLGPLDALSGVIEPLLVVLVVANVGARFLAHRSHVQQATRGGAKAMTRWLPHEVSNVVLVAASFYYATVEPHGGTVLSTLVLGMVIADFFEFESRKVEARTDEPLDVPKSALAASALVFAYALFQAGFFLVSDYWEQVI